ncbi:TPA: DUF4942 domain-containing protein [Escherichia coli]|nr:DUF4942 domain-containing protein [Escherichia coli]
MNTLPDTHVREASGCPSPVTIWQTLLTRLLDQHYGLTLNDTPFADERVIEQHIEAGISLCDAVNFLVEKYALVRTDHTDVICSTSVSHILAVRKTTLLQIDTLIRQLAEISSMTESIGGKTSLDWAMKQDFRCGCWLMEKPETAMKAITRNLDREIWRDLMQRSGMLSLMDAQARDTWYRSLEYDNFPEISEANIWSTFEQLHQNKDEVFERGVINVFRGLSWNYKTNSPCKFGSKIIVNNLVRGDRWGLHLITGQQADRLADLERMLYLFSGKPIPDNRENIIIRLDDHIRSVQGKACYEDEMFNIRYFKKGSAHITFRKPELVDRLNDIIARHYSEMLPSL